MWGGCEKELVRTEQWAMGTKVPLHMEMIEKYLSLPAQLARGTYRRILKCSHLLCGENTLPFLSIIKQYLFYHCIVPSYADILQQQKNNMPVGMVTGFKNLESWWLTLICEIV